MDDQTVTSRSLQSELTKWTVIITLAICTLGGITTGLIAYFEAKDIQDDVLQQIARLVSGINTDHSTAFQSDYDDSDILVEFLGRNNSRLELHRNHRRGFATISAKGVSWRVYITTNSNEQRFAVAQQTELINEIAWANMVSAMLPIGVLALILIGLTHWIISKRMKPIRTLAQLVDQQTANTLNPLSTQSVPKEITPFIEAINRLLLRTKQTIDRQRRFIADASHELRTPITALSLLAENHEKAASQLERSKHQSLLRMGLDRMNNLVNQLLSLTRLQNLDSPASKEVRLDDIVENVVITLHPLAEHKKIDLGIVGTMPVDVLDKNQTLQQLVENAVANAIHYTPEHGRVDIGIYLKNNLAELVIEDTGPGIKEHELEKIFDPFYRSENETQSGSGLGLAICSEIATLHNGQITLKNRKSGGLRFTYTQPLLTSS